MLADLGPINDITSRIIKCAIEVHRQLGPGLLESVYQACLCHELSLEGLAFQRECSFPVIYRGVAIGCVHKLDLLIEEIVVGELKCVETVLPVHRAQLLTQMKIANKPAGLLLNFKVPVMKDGITRMLNREALKNY
jgi:GxxExxY protein